MFIYLYGPPGSGKSTIAALLAQNLGMKFLDLDAEIEKRSSTSIETLFTEKGEAAFREIEYDILAQIHTQYSNAVIALGGGALLDLRNKQMALENGKVICLSANFEILFARLLTDIRTRPLLNKDPYHQLQAILSKRRDHYTSFGIPLDTSGRESQEIADEAQIRLGAFRISGMGQDYDIQIEPNIIDRIVKVLKLSTCKDPFMIVCDENVKILYGDLIEGSLLNAGYKVKTLCIASGEYNKTIRTVEQIWQGFIDFGIERSSTIIALGGGVTTDLAGFAAATFLRGVSWVIIPTTLLAMVDASVGGKTGADLPQGKNLIGAFHPPRLILADPQVLSTLPSRELRNGIAEALKHGIIADEVLYQKLRTGWTQDIDKLTRIISQAIAVKIKIIKQDPYERGLRQSLNFGHTVGHGIELASGFDLSHGEAVAIGMVAETRLAERLHLAQPGLADEIASTLGNLGLPVEIPKEIDRQAVIHAMCLDKKRDHGQIHFALPVEIGKVKTGVTIDRWEHLIDF